jgi:hypothetical protein
MLFFVLRPCKGELLKFEKKEHYEKLFKEEDSKDKLSSLNTAEKLLKKYNVEVIYLKNILSIYPSFCS